VDVSPIVEAVGRIMDVAGVLAILLGALLATVVFAAHVRPAPDFEPVYRSYRQGLGRAILLGLEILVAADIIRTVAISPSFASVGVLALIVLVRTFLSFTLQLEIEGRWPWEKRPAPGPARSDRGDAGTPDARAGGSGPYPSGAATTASTATARNSSVR
jgi:uncharacterized membrane protein